MYLFKCTNAFVCIAVKNLHWRCFRFTWWPLAVSSCPCLYLFHFLLVSQLKLSDLEQIVICICPNWRIYLFNCAIIFFQIYKCICVYCIEDISLGGPLLSDRLIANSLLESHLQLKVNESQVENCVKTVCLSHIYFSIAPSRCEFETHGEENNHDRAEVKMLSKL